MGEVPILARWAKGGGGQIKKPSHWALGEYAITMNRVSLAGIGGRHLCFYLKCLKNMVPIWLKQLGITRCAVLIYSFYGVNFSSFIIDWGIIPVHLEVDSCEDLG